MRMFKEGGHRLFERDPETSRVVGEMLADLEAHGLEAVRRYSRKFDDWDPPSFELSETQIEEAIGRLDPQVLRDTDFCQGNVRAFAQACRAELETQLAALPTREVAELSWRDNGRIYIAGSREEAVKLADDYAPEHLELHVADPDFYFRRLRNYGSLFIGEETTVAYGDKCIGTNHILPTSA